MNSLTAEKHAITETITVTIVNNENDPYDIKKCVEWIQINKLQQVQWIYLQKYFTYALIKE